MPNGTWDTISAGQCSFNLATIDTHNVSDSFSLSDGKSHNATFVPHKRFGAFDILSSGPNSSNLVLIGYVTGAMGNT